ncbi:MAG: N-methyl-L-tryptophan oxidase [Betaproteobacteria bacterium]|nr:N-methyl-L-tryptophan oxidase [Betaproteobacteria bacterium]
MKPADLLVVGLGAMGSAVAYHAARRGLQVIGIDRFAPPHVRGSTHGQSRITREAIGEGEQFVPLARRSHMLWRELESETGASLLHACGGLIVARRGAASRMHAQADFFGTTVRAARRFGIAHEILDAAAIRARPAFTRFAVEDDAQGYFEPGAGWLDPEACVGAHLQRARAMGAHLLTDTAVQRVDTAGTQVVVHTARGAFTAARLVIAAGAWLPQLAPQFAPGRLVVRRQVMFWFADDAPRRDEPVFIWHWGEGEDAVFYGFPGRDGAIKMAAETLAGSTPPEAVDRVVRPDESAAFFERHARTRIRGALADCVRAATCLYTIAPRANFVIDTLPNCSNAIAVTACSGHGFKHSAAIGEAVAQWVENGKRPEVLGPFALGLQG